MLAAFLFAKNSSAYKKEIEYLARTRVEVATAAEGGAEEIGGGSGWTACL